MAIPQYAPVIGGAERQAQALSEGLAARGHEIRVLTQAVEGAAVVEEIGGVQVLRRLGGLPLGPLFGLTYLWSAAHALAELAPWADAIHCHQWYFHSAWAGRMRTRGGAPVVCKAVSSGPEGDLALLRSRRGGQILLSWGRRVDRVLATCEAVAQESLAAGFRPEQIARIPNCVDTTRFRPAAEASPSPQAHQTPLPPLAGGRYNHIGGDNCSSLPRPAPSNEWLFLGRFYRLKGPDILLRAWAEARRHGSRARLAIAGKGPMREDLHSLARELALGDSIRFLGQIEDALPLYRAACGVVLPSRTEGLSNVLLEALACETPVIATDVGGTAEALGANNGGESPTFVVPPSGGSSPAKAGATNVGLSGFAWAPCGLLVRPGDPAALAAALLEAEHSAERLSDCSKAGAKRARTVYARDVVLDKLERLYQDLSGKSS